MHEGKGKEYPWMGIRNVMHIDVTCKRSHINVINYFTPFQAIAVHEEDIGTYTIKAAFDPRALNKTLHIRPPANIITLNELVDKWEKKIGKTLEKITVTEEEFVKKIESMSLNPFFFSLDLFSLSFVCFLLVKHSTDVMSARCRYSISREHFSIYFAWHCLQRGANKFRAWTQ